MGKGSALSTTGKSPPRHGSRLCGVESKRNNSRAVWIGRALFVLCLLGTAGALGAASHYFLSESENDLANKQFVSIAERALVEAHAIAYQARQTATTMATTVATGLPSADAWPLVFFDGFEGIATNMLNVAGSLTLGLAPFVTQEQLEAFENYTYEYNFGRFEEGTGMSSFGKGIWKPGIETNAPDNRVHDTVINRWGSPYNIYAPVIHMQDESSDGVMFNVHFDQLRGSAVDRVIACAEQGKQFESPYACGSLTTFIGSFKIENEGPSALMLAPVFPRNNPGTCVGVIGSLIVWDFLLKNVFADEVTGIDCVLESDEEAFTYTIVDGVAIAKGNGDLHQAKHEKHRQFAQITGDELYTETSPKYTLSLYPSDDFYQVYSTRNPKVATFGVIGIIMFMCLVFFLYDSFVRREFTEKEDLLTAKRNFMRFVSHEVRTPLNSVRMGLDVIYKEMSSTLGMNTKCDVPEEPAASGLAIEDKIVVNKSDAAEWMELTNEVLGNVESAVEVLTDLLNFDKIEAGTLAMESTQVQIWELIERSLEAFSLAAENKNIELQLQFENNLYKVEQLSEEIKNSIVVGDSVRLTQVLRNLLSNGVKFTPVGGTITVRANRTWPASKSNVFKKIDLSGSQTASLREAGFLEVSVQDSGAGMSPDQLDKLFGDGIQFNKNELQAGGGSGIGLFLSKGIVEQHGGNLWATSPGLGKGTTFHLRLPLYQSPTGVEMFKNRRVSDLDTLSSHTMPACSTFKTVNHDEAESGGQRTFRILVVDDSSSNRKLLCRLLEQEGHVCTLAENGQVAVDLVRNAMKKDAKPFDTILLDYLMPVMDGPTAASTLREIGCESFIVAITGNVLPEDIAYFEQCGANAVLAKPFQMKKLQELWTHSDLL